MKKILIILTVIICFCENTHAQLLNFAANYKFEAAYDTDDDETQLQGVPPKINLVVCSSNFFGVFQSNCSYRQYIPGMDWSEYVTMDYYGINNQGWYSYGFAGMVVNISHNTERARVYASWYNGCYAQYRKL